MSFYTKTHLIRIKIANLSTVIYMSFTKYIALRMQTLML
jgi:hypothetical protein